MPIIDNDELRLTPGQRFESKEVTPNETEHFTTSDIFQSALEEANPWVSLAKREQWPDRTVENADFNPIDKALSNGVNDPDMLDLFTNVDSEQEFNNTMNYVNRRGQNQKILDESGAAGLLAILGAAALDPLVLLPVAKGTAVAFKTADTALKGAIASSRVAFPSVTASETLLSASQPERSELDTITAVATGTLVAGLLGGTAVTGRKLLGLNKKVEAHIGQDEIAKTPSTPNEQVEAFERSLSAAETPSLTLEQQGLDFSNLGFKAGAKSIGKLSPTVRALQSDSVAVREMVQKLTDIPNLTLAKNLEDIPTPLSAYRSLEIWKGGLGEALETHGKQYKAHVKARKLNGEKALTKTQFSEEVTKAFRRKTTSSDPQIQAAASAYRSKVYDFGATQMIDTKAMPKDLADLDVGATASYANRVFNKKKIVAFTDDWKASIDPWARRTAANETRKLRKQIKELEAKAKKTGTDSEALEEARIKLRAVESKDDFNQYIEDVKNSITDKILGLESTTEIVRVEAAARGPLKDRTFNIDDLDIEDFLENDIAKLAQRFVRVGGAETELHRSFGTARFKEAVKPIQDEFKERLSKVTDPKERLKLEAKHKSELSDMRALWELVRGTYRATTSAPDNFVRRGSAAARTFNYLSSLGAVTAASIPDMAQPILSHGFGRVFKDVIASSLNPLKRQVLSLNKKELQLTGQAMEHVLNARSMSLYDIGDPIAEGTAFERMIDAAGRQFGNMTGLNYWNNTWKSVDGIITQQRMMEAVMQPGDLNKSQTIFMNKLGLGPAQRRIIKKELDQHMSNEGNLFAANTELWGNSEAVRMFRGALSRHSDQTIITKSPGDAPIFTEGNVGKTLTQFNSFTFAATQKLLLAGLQKQDLHVMQGFSALFMMGMLTYAIRQGAAGRPISDDPRVWVLEGVDRSGIGGAPMWFNNTALETAGFGAGRLAGQQPSRIAGQSALERIGGPSAGKISDLFKVSNSVSRSDFGRSDLHDIRKMIPYQNHLVLKYLFDATEEGIANSTGLPKKKKRKRSKK